MQKTSKGVEGVCKSITVMNDNGISAGMGTAWRRGGDCWSWVTGRS